MWLPGGLNSENLLPLCVSCFKIQNAGRETSGLMWEGVFEIRSHQDDTRCATSKNTSEYCRCGARCWADQIQPKHPQGVMFCVSVLAGTSTEMASWQFVSTVYIRDPQPLGQELVPVCGLLGTGPHSRKWEASERASEAPSVFIAVPHPSLVSPWSMEKLSSTKLIIPSARRVRDHCFKSMI